jgi:hypothetical protein
MPKRAAVGAKASLSDATLDLQDSNLTRMKKRLDFWSPNWALSTMLHSWSSKKEATPATSPIRSGQESLRTPCIAVEFAPIGQS